MLKFIRVQIFSGFMLFLGFSPITVLAVPIQDEFERNQAENRPGVFPQWKGTPPVHQDLSPNLTYGINKPHPLPKAVFNFQGCIFVTIQSVKRDMLDFVGLTRSHGGNTFELPAGRPLVSRYPHLIEKFWP